REEKKLEFLACLARLGPAAAEVVPAIRRLLGAKGKLGLYAVVTLLCIDPGDDRLVARLIAALKGRDKEALEACAEVGRKVRALGGVLAGIVRKGDDSARVKAAKALEKMGPLAEPAVPALAEMLAYDPDRNERGSERERVNFAAAAALASIGKAGIPP